jgi:tetratricopeptide (TPR) repeat protein
MKLRTTAALLLLLFVGTVAQAQTKTTFRTVTFATEPGARVFIDGVLFGTASDSGTLKVTTVPPGRKMIAVRADGFKEVTKPLLAAQSGTINIPLTQKADEAELAFQEGERLSAVNREQAIASFEKAVKLRPAYAEAFVGMARMYAERGETDKAEKAIAAARRAKPGWAEASAVEGRILKNVDEEPKAIAAFQRAIREGKGFQPEAYAGLGLLYKEKAENSGAAGEYDKESANYAEAAKYLTTAIKQLSGAPDSVVLYQFLGMIYEQQRKPEKAIAVYEEFLRIFPDHPEAAAFESFIVQLRKNPDQQ